MGQVSIFEAEGRAAAKRHLNGAKSQPCPYEASKQLAEMLDWTAGYLAVLNAHDDNLGV